MAKIKVRAFSIYSDIIGDRLVLNVEDRLSLRGLIEALIRKQPRLAEFFEKVSPIILVNGRSRDENYVLRDGDEVAILPPASGG